VRRQPGRQRLLVVDEVWRLLRHPAGAAFLESLARLARAAGLGLVAISQDVRVVLEDKYGRTMGENAATVLLLGQSPETLRPLVEAYGLSEDEQADLLTIGAGRDPGGNASDGSADRRGEGDWDPGLGPVLGQFGFGSCSLRADQHRRPRWKTVSLRPLDRPKQALYRTENPRPTSA
jgi:hypothetical protein